jgi:antitoxin PrlF
VGKVPPFTGLLAYCSTRRYLFDRKERRPYHQERNIPSVRNMQATITSKGQVTVPKAVRDRFHLSPGDKIEFLIDEDGTLRVIPVTATLRELKGMVPKPDRGVSLTEMQEAIIEGAFKS